MLKYVAILVFMQMISRHTKSDVTSIPPPIYNQILLKMSDSERSAYNAMVALVQSNIVTTENDYVKTNGTHRDSVLNPTNKKYLQGMLLNVRISACGGGRANLILPARGSRLDNCIKFLQRFQERRVDSFEAKEKYVSSCGGYLNCVGRPRFIVGDALPDITQETILSMQVSIDFENAMY